MKEKLKKFFHKPIGGVVISLAAALVCSFSACLVQTSGFQYSVKTVTADMDAFYADKYGEEANYKPSRMSLGTNKDGMLHAKLTGNLYMPKGVSKDNPRPVICLTHGYLNSKEFEEAPAIEMARRGYVVFAFDQYDHGDSTWDTPAQFNFYMWSVYDAAQYMSSQDYCLKDAKGNAMLAVSGHSMGGFSSEMAVMYDQLDVMYGQPAKITASLAVGADFRYVAGVDTMKVMFGNRSCGTIASDYDEFFFDNAKKADGTAQHSYTVLKKDYASDPVGYALLGLTSAGEANTWYKVDPTTGMAYADPAAIPEVGYGERIIYQVAGDHPYNTWSPEATGRMIEFYTHAFEYQTTLHGLKAPSEYGIVAKSGQTWWLKEIFTCLGLFAVVACMIFCVATLVRLPLARKVVTSDAYVPAVPKASKPRRIISGIVSVFSILLSGWLIPAFMDRSSSEGLTLVSTLCHVAMYTALGIGVAALIVSIVLRIRGKEEEEKGKQVLGRVAIGAAVIGFLSLVLNWVVTDGTSRITSGSVYWNAPSVNTIVYWAVASGLLGCIISLIDHFVLQKDRTVAHLGLKANGWQVFQAFIIACVTATVGYLIILLSTVIFTVDFRVYTYAFNAITGPQFVSALRYIPLFFIYYLCAGVEIAEGTAGMKGVKADVKAACILTLPVVLFLAYQYGVLLTTGTGAWNNFALNGILCQGLVFTLIFAAVIQRRTLAKTNNIWTGVFLNTIWFTMITLASTTVYQLVA